MWEIFLPDVGPGARYKYEIRSRDGVLLPLKADPYALRSELRPATASIVASLPEPEPAPTVRQSANALDARSASTKCTSDRGGAWMTTGSSAG